MKHSRFLLLFIAQMLYVNSFSACTSTPKSEITKVKTEQPVCNNWIHPDQVAYQALGRHLTDVLINAKTIKVYSLIPKEQLNPDDYEVDAHFVRDSLLGTLTKEQATVLAYNLISNGANYHKDSTLIVMSPYYPVIEFEFTKKKEVAHIIISLSNYSWAVKFDDKIQFKYNYASGTFIKRFCDYFLNENKNKKK